MSRAKANRAMSERLQATEAGVRGLIEARNAEVASLKRRIEMLEGQLRATMELNYQLNQKLDSR